MGARTGVGDGGAALVGRVLLLGDRAGRCRGRRGAEADVAVLEPRQRRAVLEPLPRALLLDLRSGTNSGFRD